MEVILFEIADRFTGYLVTVWASLQCLYDLSVSSCVVLHSPSLPVPTLSCAIR